MHYPIALKFSTQKGSLRPHPDTKLQYHKQSQSYKRLLMKNNINMLSHPQDKSLMVKAENWCGDKKTFEP